MPRCMGSTSTRGRVELGSGLVSRLALSFSGTVSVGGGDAVPSSRRSMRAIRSAHTQPNTHVVSPMIKACSNSKGLRRSGQMALAMPSIRGATAGLWRLMLASPCRRALRLATAFPAGVFGPRLLRAFLRLAAICFSELISGPLWALRPPLPRFRPQDWARTPQYGRWERVAVMRVRYRAWTQAAAQLAQARRQMQLPPFCLQERVGVRLPQCRRWKRVRALLMQSRPTER